MSSVNHILFPVDFSARCIEMRPFVASMAQSLQAKVTLLNVIDIPPSWFTGVEQIYPWAFDIDSMVVEGRKQLAEFFEPTKDGLSIETAVFHGDPSASITTYAETHDVGLIMMPTHGYGKFRSLLLGSVTAKVLHDAKCPVSFPVSAAIGSPYQFLL